MGIKVEQQQFEVEVLIYNLQRIRLINKILLLLLLTGVTIFFTFRETTFSQFHSIVSEGWISIAVLLTVISFYVYLLDIKKVTVSEHNYKIINILLKFYILFFINFAALHSVIHYQNDYLIFVYPLALFTIIPFLVISASVAFTSLFTSSVLVLFGISVQNANFFMLLLYIVILSVIVLTISRSSYFIYLDSYKLRTEKTKEIQQLKNLTKLLIEENKQLEQDASIDPLTNLYNRRAYNEYLLTLQQQIFELDPLYSISVIMVDVDCFKLFNDTYGHAAGDNVLRKIGKLLQDLSVETDCFAARWGGEEFILILPNGHEDAVEMLCYQIRKGVYDLDIEHLSSNIENVVTVSIGACSKRITELDNIFECISEADEALYAVKKNGRNSFEYRHQLHII